MSTAWPCCAIRSSPTQTRYLHASAKGGPAPLRLAYDITSRSGCFEARRCFREMIYYAPSEQQDLVGSKGTIEGCPRQFWGAVRIQSRLQGFAAHEEAEAHERHE